MSVIVNVVGKYSDTEIKKAQADLGKLATDADKAGKKATTSFSLAGKASKLMATGIVAIGSAAGSALVELADKAVEFAKKSIEAYSELGGQVRGVQRIIGGSAEFASRLVSAWKMTGVGIDVGSVALARMEKHVAANDKAWQGLGVSAKDSHGKLLPMSALLPKVADAFAGMPAGVEKTALAMGLFGSRGGGLAMLTFLNKGSAGMAALGEESDKLGTTLSGKDLSATLAATVAKRKMGEAVEGLQISLGKDLYPIITKVITFFTDVAIPGIRAFAANIWQGIQPAVQSLTDTWNGGLHQALIDAWPTIVKVAGFIGTAWVASINLLAKAVSFAVPGIVWLVNAVGTTIVAAANIAIDAFNAMATAYNNTIGRISGVHIDSYAQLHWSTIGAQHTATAGEQGYMPGTNNQVPAYTVPAKAAPTAPSYTPPTLSRKVKSGGSAPKTAAAAKMTMADIMTQALAGAQKVLDDFHKRGQAVLDFISTIKSATVSFGSITGYTFADVAKAQQDVASAQKTLTDATTANEKAQAQAALDSANTALAAAQKANTVESVIGGMSGRVRQAQQFVKDVGALRKLGLNNASLQEIISAGPKDGDAIAAALLSGGLASVLQVNDLENQLNAAGSQLGDQGALSQYGMDAAQARSMVSTTLKVEKGALVVNVGAAGVTPAELKEITKAVDASFDAMVKKLERELKAGAKK